MNTTKRQKLCQVCEGEVDFDVIFCPFCGADLLKPYAVSSSEDPLSKALSEKESTLYPSSYIDYRQELHEQNTGEELKYCILPILLLSAGVWLLLLGMYLFLFSSGGELYLAFDAQKWFGYIILAAPLLFFGTKLLLQEP